MDRRRFLKYAGATAAVLGASALGLDYLVKPTPPVMQTTVSSTEVISTTSLSNASSVSFVETTSTMESGSLDLGANDLGGYVFHDYNGNGQLDQGEPFVNDVEIVAQGDHATFKVKPQNGIYVFRNLSKDRYRLYPVSQNDKFRYMCRSNSELVETRFGYRIDFNGKQRLDMALMQGPLTLPLMPGTKYSIGEYYDWDPDPLSYLWWNGKHGLESEHEGGSNHAGVDYDTHEGEDVVAPAPGVFSGGIQKGSQGQIGIAIYHEIPGFVTFYNHLSKVVVSEGQTVVRGQKIAETGSTGAGWSHLHFNISKSVQAQDALLDPYRPTFHTDVNNSGYWVLKQGDVIWQRALVASNPNLLGYWTKDNDLQYSTSAS